MGVGAHTHSRPGGASRYQRSVADTATRPTLHPGITSHPLVLTPFGDDAIIFLPIRGGSGAWREGLGTFAAGT